MSSFILLLFLVLVSSIGEASDVIFDVTTIYDLGNIRTNSTISGRVEKRTNSLGLDLYSDGVHYEQNSQNSNLTCDSSYCAWDKSRWTNEEKPFRPTSPIHGYNQWIRNYHNSDSEELNNLTPDKWMESPSFVPSSRSMCLVIEYHTTVEFFSRLKIYAKDPLQKEHQITTISDISGGEIFKHITLHFDDKIVNNTITLIIESDDSDTEIRRISTCDTSGTEIEVLPDLTSASPPRKLRSELPIYTAKLSPLSTEIEAVPYLTSTSPWEIAVEPEDFQFPCQNGRVETSAGCACPPGFSGTQCETVATEPEIIRPPCENGGVNTTAGCACPPGFSGTQCKTGCGRNRFGQDCEGSCSFRRRGCEGFLLCSTFTRCQCAPGYHGDFCTTKCLSGRYGNDCKQQCGNCAIESSEPLPSCDIYSGKCKACQTGYVPPYCKQEYVHYYREPVLRSEDYGSISVLFDLQDGVRGVGEANIYQIQYRQKGTDEWKTYISKVTPKSNSMHAVTETIEGLMSGIEYQVRLILMDASYNKYDGDLVAAPTIRTKCDIPDVYDYQVQSSSTWSTFSFSWAYELANIHWCALESFEFTWKENKMWYTYVTKEPKFSLSDFEPGKTIEFKVRAKTFGGYAPYSTLASISTLGYGTGSVEDLHMVYSHITFFQISWKPPIGSAQRSLNYTIAYKCINRIACGVGCENASEGQLSQRGTTLTLRDLLPFSQYLVKVTPEDGEEIQTFAATTQVVPTEVPVISDQKPVRTNSSVTVFWDPVPVCSSFLQGYTYQLTQAEETKLLDTGFTKYTNISFYNLSASTNYSVKVFITTQAGKHPDRFLEINVSTTATVPEAVRNLTVYKRGRNMLGLRWAEPRIVYGQLKSFTIQYSSDPQIHKIDVEPTHCIVWPHLFCHTLENLSPNRKYTVLISARNIEVDEDGVKTSVTAFTRESAPMPPEGVTVLNRTSTSVGLQWKMPEMVNGVLRSFVVNVEESERVDQDSCCQIYPLVEIPVKEESKFYEVEISGLHPASTIYISVSAKTVSMGASTSLIVSTRPPHLPFNILPDVTLLRDIGQRIEWLTQENQSEVNSSDIYSSLVRARILLLTFYTSESINSNNQETGVKNKEIDSLLHRKIAEPFCFYTEYDENGEISESVWGERKSSCDFKTGKHNKLVAVQISSYNDSYNIDYRFSAPMDKSDGSGVSHVLLK